MMHFLRHARRGAFASLIGAAILSLIAADASAQSKEPAPTWSRGRQEMKIGYEECLARVPLGYKTLGISVESAAVGVFLGKKENHLIVVGCHPLPEVMLVDVVVASNGGNGSLSGVMRVTVQQEMAKSSCRPTTWGFEYCYGREANK